MREEGLEYWNFSALDERSLHRLENINELQFRLTRFVMKIWAIKAYLIRLVTPSIIS